MESDYTTYWATSDSTKQSNFDTYWGTNPTIKTTILDDITAMYTAKDKLKQTSVLKTDLDTLLTYEQCVCNTLLSSAYGLRLFRVEQKVISTYTLTTTSVQIYVGYHTDPAKRTITYIITIL